MKLSMRSIKTTLLSLTFLLVLSGLSAAEQRQSETEAIKAAKAFLQLIDGGQYQASWDKTAPLFQRQVSQAKWVEMLAGVRPQFGAVISRDIKVAKFSTSLPGVPDGEYVTIQFATSFEKKSKAVETVTMARVKEEWQVAGYFIK